jgi:hypothetical protein
MNKLTKGQAEAACPFVWALEKIITYLGDVNRVALPAQKATAFQGLPLGG